MGNWRVKNEVEPRAPRGCVNMSSAPFLPDILGFCHSRVRHMPHGIPVYRISIVTFRSAHE